MIESLYAILPELVLAVGAMVLMMTGVFHSCSNDAEGAKERAFASTAHSSMALILLAILSLYFVADAGLVGKFFNNLVVIDSFAIFTKALLLIGGFFTLWLTIDYSKRNHKDFPFEYSILVLLSLCGMLIMISSADFLSLYLGVELQSLALYVLAAINRKNAKSSEAAVKYFVLGALASGILLYGISLIYGFSGSTNFDDIAAVLTNQDVLSKGLIVGIILVLVGLAFKMSAAPFHMWTPDVYEGVPTPVTAYFAIVPKLAVAVLLARILTGAFPSFVGQWQDVIIIISVLSMTIGALAGVWQRNIKRLLAYSSIANMGYALVGLAAFAQNGISAMLVFFTIYMSVSIGIFAIIMALHVRSKDVNGGIEEIAHLNGMSKAHPFFAALLALMMLSMIGLPFPPFAGFFGKFFIFKSAIDAGLYGLAVIGVVSSVIAAFYYLRVVKVMYFDDLAENVRVSLHLSKATKVVLVLVVVVNAIIFFQPHELLNQIPAVNLQVK